MFSAPLLHNHIAEKQIRLYSFPFASIFVLKKSHRPDSDSKSPRCLTATLKPSASISQMPCKKNCPAFQLSQNLRQFKTKEVGQYGAT